MRSLPQLVSKLSFFASFSDGDAIYDSLPSPSKTFSLSVSFAVRTLGHVLWGYEAFGSENFAGLSQNRGFIIASNHPSYMDGAFLAGGVPRKWLKRASFLSKVELFQHKIMAPVMRIVGGIPIDRRGNTALGVSICKEFLRLGGFLVIFPEGTIPEPGQQISFRRGAARMAIETGVPVIPARIIGGDAIYRVDSPFPRIMFNEDGARCQVQVVFGVPLEPPRVPKRASREVRQRIIDEFTRDIEKCVRNLTPENYTTSPCRS